MSSARDTDRPHRPDPVEGDARDGGESRARVESPEDYAGALARLGREMERGLGSGLAGGRRSPRRGRRRERAELEALRRAARRWYEELGRLREGYEALRDARAGERGREELERALAEREAEIRALRTATADRELDLQRDHEAQTRRQREEIDGLKERLRAAESGERREEEIRELKRLAYGRERELRRSHAERLSETEREAERRLSALQAQREADNRSLVERHAAERAGREEELESLRLRRLSESRVYGGRIRELATERAGERASLEEAVAKLREKHEAERARLEERIADLEEALEEQEGITAELLEELGYIRGPGRRDAVPHTAGEIEAAGGENGPARIRSALGDLRRIADSGNRLREGLALFNETEHLRVVGAIAKSLGEPEVHAALETQGGAVERPVITLVWPGAGWRRYVSEPDGSVAEPRVYLAGSGEEPVETPGSGPNARLDGRGRLALGVRPL